MPTLDSPQFKDYAFRAQKSLHGTEAAVARRVPPGSAAATGMLHEERWEPLGSISIYSNAASQNREQTRINDPHPKYESNYHGTRVEDSGQMRWSAGNFEPDKPYVGWAAMTKVPGHSRLLSGLAAVAVAEHGSLPGIDPNLSDEGARLARGASRKYGMQPSRSNPKMEGGFSFSEADPAIRREAVSSWSIAEGGKHLTAATTAQVVKDMEDQYRLRPQKTNEHTTVLHPDQMRLL